MQKRVTNSLATAHEYSPGGDLAETISKSKAV